MKKPDAYEKQHMGRVAELGCVLCQHLGYGPTPAQTHHIIEFRGAGFDKFQIGYRNDPMYGPWINIKTHARLDPMGNEIIDVPLEAFAVQ